MMKHLKKDAEENHKLKKMYTKGKIKAEIAREVIEEKW